MNIKLDTNSFEVVNGNQTWLGKIKPSELEDVYVLTVTVPEGFTYSYEQNSVEIQKIMDEELEYILEQLEN